MKKRRSNYLRADTGVRMSTALREALKDLRREAKSPKDIGTIISLVLQGFSDSEIAGALRVSKDEVERIIAAHRGAVREALGGKKEEV